MSKVIRIGTRDSQLALWQAQTVQDRLHSLGYTTELVAVKSTGDLVLNKPLYELGITGIFTKTLDVAMLNGTVDIAVHSMKDVPTLLPEGIVQTAVLKRASSKDIVVTKGNIDFDKPATIATGSLRRKAQWLHRYPHHEVVGLRGNVNTRLQHLAENNWQGAIFAKAGLERIDVLPENHIDLDWMIPAPAQGAMVVVALEGDQFTIDATRKLNIRSSEICTHVEREFLRILEGGCTAPIGAIATIEGNNIHLEGCLFSLNGQTKLSVEKTVSIEAFDKLGTQCAQELLNNGGKKLMLEIRKATTPN